MNSFSSQQNEALHRLALDLRWSWNHSTDELWRRLDPELWDVTHNPWVVLQSISSQRLEKVIADPAVQEFLIKLQQGQKALEEPAWFQKAHPTSPLKTVAYFSMEYMLSEALPIYSGGLGNVAGDQLKAASDLGVPVVAIGLLYQQGYFRQEIDAEGRQRALYPYNDPGQMPVTPVRNAEGEWLRLRIHLPGTALWIRTWQVQVGRRKLYLLDSNDPANLPSHRGVTSELYGGGSELRLQQELVLGIAGWRLLRALQIDAQVCHLNEGHAAFAVIERARSWMEDHGAPFELALAATRAGNLFTTHTPVEAGFDRFQPELLASYLQRYAEQRLKIPFHDLLALGRQNPADEHEPFNMAYLALHGSGRINAVSRLHGVVSRRIFQPLFPRWPQPEVPVSHVTNGIHTPSWESQAADKLWSAACGNDRWHADLAGTEQALQKVSDEAIWEMRTAARSALVERTRKLLPRQLAGQGASIEEIEASSRMLDAGILTLGFARRMAAYKRPNLLLHDPERLTRILTNRDLPVQLILAGKAHPRDIVGQALVEQWIHFIRGHEVRPHVVFLNDYDMGMAQDLVHGVDVWLNTPRRPWEACGTSGMKVLVNGGLNVSELDGWWAEAYTPEVGWAIGDGKEHGNDPERDAAEANALYSLLEQEIIPAFYQRDAGDMPRHWIERIRQSMAKLTPEFSANRTVRQYTESYYLPAAEAYLQRSANDGQQTRALLDWKMQLQKAWPQLRFGEIKAAQEESGYQFTVQVYLGELNPDWVCVSLYADGGSGSLLQEMARGGPLAGTEKGYIYTAHVSADRPASDYTPRITPRQRLGAAVPLEIDSISWSH